MKLEDANLDRKWHEAVQLFEKGDMAGALFLFKSIANEGEKAAYSEIANIYQLGGEGVPQDFKQAHDWHKKAIDEADDVLGYIGLSRLYYYGAGVEQDYNKAFWYLSQTSENEKPITHLLLGKMYHLGHGTEKDVLKAEKYYKKAAESNYAFAYKFLSILEQEKRHTIKSISYKIKSFLTGLFILLTSGRDDHRLQSQ